MLEDAIVEKSCVNAGSSLRLSGACLPKATKSASEFAEMSACEAEAMTLSEFDPYNLELADRILAGTWNGHWQGDVSPAEWAVDLKRRWLEKVAENG